MATDPTIMKLRLKAINTIISAIPVRPDTSYYLDEREIGENVGESLLAARIRQELNNLPKGYNKPQHSLKTQAKVRFLQWRENQAKAEWKTLSEAEQTVWEGYVAEGVEFGEIRARELAIDEEDAILDASYVFMEENIYLTAEDLHDEMSHLSFEDCQKIVGSVVASLKDVSGWEQ